MVKERCRAEQLADMINQKINVAGVEVAVRRDHAYGWVPTVIWRPPIRSAFSDGLMRSLMFFAHASNWLERIGRGARRRRLTAGRPSDGQGPAIFKNT